MCGICGYWGGDITQDEGRTLLHRMMDQITHRGPDEDGMFVGNGVGLGIRRLKVIDLQSGSQPMTNEQGSMQLVFNGEIYNYHALRSRLMEQGHRFATRSDTEVIVHQFETDSIDCLHLLNGMFAFALYDDEHKALMLARDRVGIKPLYYYWNGDLLLFASEIKALMASGLIDYHINWHSVWHYLTFRYVPAPETIWKNVYKLPPAHFMLLNSSFKTPMPVRYWDFPYRDDYPSISTEESVDEFEKLFLDSVKKRLIADVPVGVFLSGGLDSSAITAAIAEVHNHRLSSFSVAFEGASAIDERPFAREIAHTFGTDHHEVVIDQQQFMDFLPEFVYFSDEPLADLTAIPLYYLSQQARQHVTVVLSGEGSDEILGGYDFADKFRILQWVKRYNHVPSGIRVLASPFMKRLFHGKEINSFSIRNITTDQLIEQRWGHMTRLMQSEQKHQLLPDIIGCQDSISMVARQLERCASNDAFQRMLFLYSQSWLVEDLLMKADKMSMANSLELRVPFLDHRLVEWAARQASNVKINTDRNGKLVTKWVLRRFAKKRIPQSVLERPKAGFPVPVYNWLTDNLKTWAHDLLLGTDAMLPQWLNHAGLSDMLQQATADSTPSLHQHRLWNLLILELWMRRWKPTE
ncbi:asparagine synthase (glutamine-hydrolyzing) [candidate division KSB1 bacterium]|nr:asparagine synthase (glutamine-hydrolyzing) [candidate division KSB1 bacterium]